MENKKIKPVYEVIDDFIPDYTNDHIFKILSSNRFPWYISHKVSDGNDEYWNSQYFHFLYRNDSNHKSEYYSLVDSIITTFTDFNEMYDKAISNNSRNFSTDTNKTRDRSGSF